MLFSSINVIASSESDVEACILAEKKYNHPSISCESLCQNVNTNSCHLVCLGKHTKFDVVLIDTAGRMQDNEPLMSALAKLISVNSPDLVLFVGEALVGNEATDQLLKFNRALADNAPGGAANR